MNNYSSGTIIVGLITAFVVYTIVPLLIAMIMKPESSVKKYKTITILYLIISWLLIRIVTQTTTGYAVFLWGAIGLRWGKSKLIQRGYDEVNKEKWGAEEARLSKQSSRVIEVDVSDRKAFINEPEPCVEPEKITNSYIDPDVKYKKCPICGGRMFDTQDICGSCFLKQEKSNGRFNIPKEPNKSVGEEQKQKGSSFVITNMSEKRNEYDLKPLASNQKSFPKKNLNTDTAYSFTINRGEMPTPDKQLSSDSSQSKTMRKEPDNVRTNRNVAYCYKCGEKLIPNASYCIYCGTKIPDIY